mmetsp:Transcript_296/g.352  ORF Transcript_296/g.352 Transcript_296/m.352 type:complete len:116 (-) Transcript_296:126-473(-)
MTTSSHSSSIATTDAVAAPALPSIPIILAFESMVATGDDNNNVDEDSDGTDDNDDSNIAVDGKIGNEDVGIDDDEDAAAAAAAAVTDWFCPSSVDLDVVIERRLLLVPSEESNFC